MGNYEETVRDIRETLGFVPGFMKALPRDDPDALHAAIRDFIAEIHL